jgi:hypothetical protein
MAAWQEAHTRLPTKSAPKAQDMANKISGNRRSIEGYDIVAAESNVDAALKGGTPNHGGLEVTPGWLVSFRCQVASPH